jgi:uncharacterized membrane protein YhaH (DUF805 family)
MSDEWYYALGQQRHGPVRENEVARLAAAGTIGRETLVWRAGMEGWEIAQEALPPHLRPADWPGAGPASPPPMAPSTAGSLGTAAPGDQYGRAAYHPTGFQDSVRTVFQRYATFTGRSRRPEYWWFVLFNIIVSLALAIISAILFPSEADILGGIYNLAILLPSLAVGVRRLHDLGRTGWWLLIGIVPIVGIIVLIVFFATKGEENDNEYGPA